MFICKLQGKGYTSSRTRWIYKLERAIKEHRVFTPTPLLPYPHHPFTLPLPPQPPCYPTHYPLPYPSTLHPNTLTPPLPYPHHPTLALISPLPLPPTLHPYPTPHPITQSTTLSLIMVSGSHFTTPFQSEHVYHMTLSHLISPTPSLSLQPYLLSWYQGPTYTTPYQSEHDYHMTLSHLIRVKGHNTVTISSKYMSC